MRVFVTFLFFLSFNAFSTEGTINIKNFKFENVEITNEVESMNTTEYINWLNKTSKEILNPQMIKWLDSQTKSKTKVNFNVFIPVTEDLDVSENKCFYQSKLFNGEIELNDRDLNSLIRKKNILSQIMHAYKFLADFYLKSKGAKDSIYSINEVEVCSDSVVGQTLKHDKSLKTLTIGVKEKTISGFQYYSHSKLMEMWNKGIHLINGFKISSSKLFSKIDGKVKLKLDKKAQYSIYAWPILNPVGDVRWTLRQKISNISNDYLSKINKSEKSLNEILMDIVQSNGIIEVLSSSNIHINSLSNEEVETIINKIKKSLNDKTLVENVESSVLKMFAKKHNDKKVDIDQKVKGLIAISNAHIIKVDTSDFAGSSYDNFVNTEVNIASSRTDADVKIKAEVTGLIAIHTIDVIDVKADFSKGLILKPIFDALGI